MNRPRWRKVLHDLWGGKMRTLLVVMTIAVGVFAVGFVSDMLFITLADMDVDYQSANPHGAVIYTDDYDADLLPVLQRVPGVGQVEGRGGLSARLFVPSGDKVSLSIIMIPPVDEIKIDLIDPLGSEPLPPLQRGEVYVERTTRSIMSIEPGDSLKIELLDGRIRQVRVAALVHDVTAIPYAFANEVTMYAMPETIAALGGSEEYNRVLVTVAENKTDEDHVKYVAGLVSDKMEESGLPIYFTFIYQPGRHFASDITRALGVLMMGLGILAVFLGSFLVINTINALISQQIRQIGVMKAIGARTNQILAMYVILVLAFGLLAMAITLPLGYVLGSGVGGGISDYLNFIPGPPRVSVEGLILQFFVGIVVPVATALAPVLQGTRISVREAISNYGLSQQSFGHGLIDRLLERIRGLPRPLLISLRNTFRRKGRLALTLTTLILAGAIFIGVFNLRSSMKGAIDETFGYLLSDVNISFMRTYRTEKLVSMAMSVPGVAGVEAWSGADGSLLSADTSLDSIDKSPGTADKSSGTQVSVLAPPASSKLIKATMTSGRWLIPEDENAIVIGNNLTAVRPDLKVGDEIVIEIDGEETKWEIVGIYRMAGNVIPPLLYTNKEYLAKVLNQADVTANLRIITEKHDALFQRRVSQDLQKLFDARGLQVGQAIIGSDLVAANVSQTDVLVYFMLMMAILIAVVGGLGLASTMSMNVLERTRELGVMRAIGARNGSIFQLVVVEGMVIGILSWIVGAILAVPIGSILAYAVGTSMFQSPLAFSFALDGFLLWLVLVVVISVVASMLPARSAVRMTIREVLAYE